MLMEGIDIDPEALEFAESIRYSAGIEAKITAAIGKQLSELQAKMVREELCMERFKERNCSD